MSPDSTSRLKGDSWMETLVHDDAMNVNVTSEIDPNNRDCLVMELSKHLRIGKTRDVSFRSADNLPSYIQLIGGYLAWAPLVAGATAFLMKFGEKIGERAGDDTYLALKSGAQKVFWAVVEAISRARQEAGDIPDVIVGLDIPDDYFGTSLCITSKQKDEVSFAVAKFAVKSKEIAQAVQAELDKGTGPVGGFKLTLMADGRFKVEWMDKSLKTRSLFVE